MELKALIIHRVTKEVGSNASLDLRSEAIPINDQAKVFFEKIRSAYTTGAISYGAFDANNTSYPFQILLSEYLQNSHDLTTFTHQAMAHFKTVIDRENLAKGGYVVFGHYDDQGEFLLCAMLDDKDGFVIDERTLEIKQNHHLDIDKLQRASRINFQRWQSNEESYLSFIKGTRDISRFFLEFLGCTNQVPSKTATNRFNRAIKDYVNQHITEEDRRREILEIAYEEGRNIKKGEMLSLALISHRIDPNNPDAFINFATSEVYQVDASFPVDKTALNALQYIVYNNKNLKFKIANHLIGDTVVYNSEQNALTIYNIPEDIAAQIQSRQEH